MVVDYTEGRVEVAEGDSWRLLEVGEEIAADAQLHLANAGFAQLIAGESSVTLSRAGTFDRADLLPRIQAARRWDLAAVVGSKLTGLTTGRVVEGTVMGVRGEQAGDTALLWIDDGTSAIAKVRKLNAAGEHQQALRLATKSMEFAFDDEELGFHAMYAAALLGHTSTALRLGARLDPDPLSDYYADYALVLGKLLLEVAAFQPAADVLGDYLLFRSEGSAAQAVHALTLFASRGLGDDVEAARHLHAAVALAPESATGALGAGTAQRG